MVSPGPTDTELTEKDGEPDRGSSKKVPATTLGFASIAVSSFSFIAMLRLANHRVGNARTRSLGVLMLSLLESITGVILGTMAVRQSKKLHLNRYTLLLGFAGAAFSGLTTAVAFHMMRIRITPLARLLSAEL